MAVRAVSLCLVLGGCKGSVDSNEPRSALAASDAVAHPGCRIDVAEWTEEVKLHDGQMIVVQRRARACKGGFPDSSRGRDIDFQFKYEPLGVHWTGSAIRKPRAFEVFDGVPYLVLFVMDRASCEGKPPQQYLAQFLKWSGGKWVDVPQAEFPVDRALLNLHTDYWGHTAAGDAKGKVGWDWKHTGGRASDTVKSYFEGFNKVCEFYQKS